MNKIFSVWNLNLIPNIERFYKNEYLTIIRKSFYVAMPFWLTISGFDFVLNLFLNPAGIFFDDDGLDFGFWFTGLRDEEFLQSTFAKNLIFIKSITSGCYGIIALVVTFTISNYLAEKWNTDKILTVMVSMSSFIIFATMTNSTSSQGVSDYFSEVGFFTAFFLAFTSARIFSWLYNIRRLSIKIPKYFPEDMAHYLSSTFSVMLTIIFFAVLAVAVGFLKLVAIEIFASLENFSLFQNPIVVFFYQFITWFLWWLGIPGYAMTSVIQEFAYIPAQLSNQIGETNFIFTTGFFEAGVIHVLGLMIAILVFSQHESWRTVAKFSFPLMIFNVQEVFIFGLPVILNPIFLLPYIFAPIANCLVGYVAILWGIVPVFQFDLPWTMPLILSAAIGTHSVMGGLLQVVWLVMDIFIYAPFVITANSIELKQEKKVGDKK